MIRALHRWPGLVALALLTVLALSGAALSVFPAAERLSAPATDPGLSAATLAERISVQFPGVEQIRRAPSGKITAYWFDLGTPGSAIVDPDTGKAVADADPNPAVRWLTNLHRSLFLGDAGRIVTALGAAAMLLLSASGAALVARRAGGWHRWFSRTQGPAAGRWHTMLARVAVPAFVLSSATALWMTASTFGLLPEAGPLPIPETISGQNGAAFHDMETLTDLPVTALRELTFPYPGDTSDVFTLKTDRGTGYVDQGTGSLLAWTPLSLTERVSELVFTLHTGQGAAVLGLLLGLMALGVPAMGVTGLLIWRAGARGRPRIAANATAGEADTILLVASEGGTTWGFAATLHAALTDAGQRVHTAPLSSLAPHRYTSARRIVIMAATYGNGDAPASAKGALDRLATPTADVPLAVLGFGDGSFPEFCGFARTLAVTAENAGWPLLLPFDTVDRQSPQDFERWGHALGDAIGRDLTLNHQPVRPATETLRLVSRRDYGAEVQAPTSILRFALPRASLWQRLTGKGLAGFRAGDLIGILPDGSQVPRFYSLASGARDGFVEIVVRRHPGGLCSGMLTALTPGDTVNAFLRRNPAFHPGRGRKPLLLIGAGTGVAPLAGFLRANAKRRPMHLFFGLRDPKSDLLYGEELSDWARERRLARLVTATSRGGHPRHVQDALRDDAAEVARLIQSGAKVMVCGGRQMAEGVRAALTDILAPTGLSPATLKAQGRYAEDVY